MEKSTLRNTLVAFALGAVLGTGATIYILLPAARNQRAAFAATIDALADSRRIASDYRRELDSAKGASGELVDRLARTLPEIAKIGSERERALASVRILREVFNQLRKKYDPGYQDG